MTKRAKTLTTTIAIVACLVFAPLAVDAQQAGKVYRIGFLSKRSISAMQGRLEAFRQGLHELGYVEGKNIKILFLSAVGRGERFPALVAELINQKVDVIVTLGGDPVRAAMKATKIIPIVVAVAGDFVGRGYAKSLSRPGGNVTGLSTMAQDLMGKQLQIFKEAVPTLTRLAIIRFPGKAHVGLVQQAKVAASSLGLRIIPINVDGASALPGAFRRISAEGADGILVLRSGFLLRLRGQILALARKAALPTMFGHRQEAESGGLIAYGTDTNALFRGSARYVDKILRGANPAEMPVARPTKFHFVVNLKTANALGITFPPSILLRATEVIE